MTVIYLSNYRIQVVGGTGGANAVIERSAVSNEITSCLFNGSVVDKDRFCQIVTDLFEKNGFSKKNAVLVLNSTQIIVREMRVPAIDEASSTAFIANELAEVDRAQTPVYGYETLSVDKKARLRQVLAVMADETYLRSFVELFQRCGITLSSIQPAIYSAIRALGGTATQGKTCIVQLLEGDGFTSVLFVDGEYVYSTQNRLASKRGSAEFGGEIARATSAIIQFAKAQKIEQPVSEVLFAGFTAEELAAASDVIGRMGGLKAGPLPDGSRVGSRGSVRAADCVFAGGGLLTASKSSNLLLRMSRTVKPRKKLGTTGKGLCILAALLVVMLAASAATWSVRRERQNELDELNNWLNSARTQERLAQYEQTAETQRGLIGRAQALETALESLRSYPLPNARINQVLQTCASDLVTVEIVEYDSVTGELKLDTRAAEVTSIHEFITRLSEQSAFALADYTGYEYLEAESVFSVYVVVQLAGDAGREVAQ